MRHILGGVALIAVVVAGPATAADMPVRAPIGKAPIMAAPAYNWSGCYVGAGGGYGMFNQDSFRYFDAGFVPMTTTGTTGGRGWFGTIQGGCDYQLMPSIVVGAFADYDFASIKGEYGLLNSVVVGTEKMTSAWAAGGRIGWLPIEQLMAYVSAGYTQAKFDQVDLHNVLPPFTPTGYHFLEHTYRGWFIGTGYEYALGFLPGLFWKTEYRFSTFRADNFSLLLTGVGPTGDGINSRIYTQTLRSELVWRFNWGGAGKGPVVSRY